MCDERGERRAGQVLCIPSMFLKGRGSLLLLGLVAALAQVRAGLPTPTAVVPEVPHFSQCSRCTKCIALGPKIVGEVSPASTPLNESRRVYLSALNESRLDSPSDTGESSRSELSDSSDEEGMASARGLPEHLHPRHFAPSHSSEASKHKPKCGVCHGCSVQLIDISDAPPVDLPEFKLQFHSDSGMSSKTTWVMRALPLPIEAPATAKKARNIRSKPQNEEKDQSALVKIYCVPRELGKAELSKGHWASQKACSQDAYARTMLNIGLKRLSEDCGMGEMLPDVWADLVQGTLPVANGSKAGYTVDWMGCWNTFVPGVSMYHILTTPPGSERMQDDLHKRLNRTQVILGALYDVLTSQSDRHEKNVLFLPDGQLRLIDNEECMGNHPLSRFLKRGVNSIFVPGTRNFNLPQVERKAEHDKAKFVAPFSLDYRCAVDENAGGSIGFNYPTGFSQCLKRISSLSIEEITERYHLPHANQPRNLRQCARDMLEKGFEWTYTRGAAQITPWFLQTFMQAAPPKPQCD